MIVVGHPYACMGVCVRVCVRERGRQQIDDVECLSINKQWVRLSVRAAIIERDCILITSGWKLHAGECLKRKKEKWLSRDLLLWPGEPWLEIFPQEVLSLIAPVLSPNDSGNLFLDMATWGNCSILLVMVVGIRHWRPSALLPQSWMAYAHLVFFWTRLSSFGRKITRLRNWFLSEFCWGQHIKEEVAFDLQSGSAILPKSPP